MQCRIRKGSNNVSYADEVYYRDDYGGTLVPSEDLKKQLNKASRQVDTLTFCRIRSIGFEHLTEFQQDQIRYTVCLLTDFLYENADELETMLTSYSINGTSMSFAIGQNIMQVQGILIRSDIYAELQKTGLCFRGV